ncbi:hypothetical protein BST61_g4881 [Cercospora zeina]
MVASLNLDSELFTSADTFDTERFNEVEGPSKRRKMSREDLDGPNERMAPQPCTAQIEPHEKAALRRFGPFCEESDSEQEEEMPAAVIAVKDNSSADLGAMPVPEQNKKSADIPVSAAAAVGVQSPPTLVKDETSYEPVRGR